MKKEIINLYSWVNKGSRRIKILKSLEKNKFPNKIQKDTNLNFSNVSEALKLFLDKKLIVCKNPKEKTGRIYELTKLGKEILKEIQELEN